MRMYRLSHDGNSITCLQCHFTSYHDRDVRERYCPICHIYHDDAVPLDELPPVPPTPPLFELDGESLSPRARWMRSHDIRFGHLDDDVRRPWIAYRGRIDDALHDRCALACGSDPDEALLALADTLRLAPWITI